MSGRSPVFESHFQLAETRTQLPCTAEGFSKASKRPFWFASTVPLMQISLSMEFGISGGGMPWDRFPTVLRAQAEGAAEAL